MGELLDQLFKDAEVDFDEEAEALSEMMTQEMVHAIIMIEALGSITTVDDLGLLDTRLHLPPEMIDRLYEITPESRHGEGTGLEAEMQWETIVSLVRENYGDRIEKIRDAFNTIMDERGEDRPDA